MKPSRNIAARAGRWSATHRKTAIWGWLAFVVLAVFIGGSVGTRTLTDAESGVGESGKAGVVTSENFPENASEQVLITAPAGDSNTSPSTRQAANELSRELKAAAAFARRRRLGPYRTKDREPNRLRDLAALARAGFAYDLARKVIDAADPDALAGTLDEA